MSYQDNSDNQIQKYTGLPNKGSPEEISLWKKFLNAVLPWLTSKWALGNAYLEAKVNKERNEADKIMAETTLLQIRAEKEVLEVIELASKQDKLNAKENQEKDITDEEMKLLIRDFVENVKLMSVKHGMKISFSIDINDLENPVLRKLKAKLTFEKRDAEDAGV
jgi:hypothetical protein